MFYPNQDVRTIAAERYLQTPYALRNFVAMIYRSQTSPAWLHLYLGRHAPVTESNVTQATLEHPNTKSLVDEYLSDPDALYIGPQTLYLWHWTLPVTPPKFYPISEFVQQMVTRQPPAQQTDTLEIYLKTGVQLARGLVHQNLSWAADSAERLSAALAELAVPWLLRQFGSRGVAPLALVISPEIGPAETRPERLFSRFPPAPPSGLLKLDQWRLSLLTGQPPQPGNLPFPIWQWSTHRHLFSQAHVIFGLQEIRHLLLHYHLLPAHAVWLDLRPAYASVQSPGLWLAALHQLRSLWQTHADLPPVIAQPIRRQIEAEITYRNAGVPAAGLAGISLNPTPPHIFFYRTPQKSDSCDIAIFQTLPTATGEHLPAVSPLPVTEPTAGHLGNILWQRNEQRAYSQTLSLLSSNESAATAAAQQIRAEQALAGCLLLNCCAGTLPSAWRNSYRNLNHALHPPGGFSPTVPGTTRAIFNLWALWFVNEERQPQIQTHQQLLIRVQALAEQARSTLRELDHQDRNTVPTTGIRQTLKTFAGMAGAALAVLQNMPVTAAVNYLLREIPVLRRFQNLSEDTANGFVQITDEIQAVEFARWFEQNLARLQPLSNPQLVFVGNPLWQTPPLFNTEFLINLLALLTLLHLKENIQARLDIDDQLTALRNLNSLFLSPHRRRLSGPPHEFETLKVLYYAAAQNIAHLIEQMDTDPQVQIELTPATPQERFYRGQQASLSVQLVNHSHVPAHNVIFQINPDSSFELATRLDDDNESASYSRQITKLLGGHRHAQNLMPYAIVPQGHSLNITVLCMWQRKPAQPGGPPLKTISHEYHWSWPVQTAEPQQFIPISMRFSGGDGSPILAPNKFYGAARRGKLVSLAATLIEQPLNYLLWAPKRVGKTTFLYMVRKIILNEDNARQTFGLIAPRFSRLDNYIPAFVSLMRLRKESANANPFYFEILWQVRESVAIRLGEPKSVVETYVRYLATAYPGPISVNQVERELHRLLAQLKNPNARILILLDEYDRVYELIHSAIDANVRVLLTETERQTRNICWIISSTLGLYKQRQIYGSPLFGVLSRLELDPLDRQDVKMLIEDGIPQGEVSFARGVIDWIYRDAGGHPYYTQVLCKNLVDYLNQTGSNFVSFEILQTVGQQLMEEATLSADADPHYGWRQAPPTGKYILLAVGQARTQNIARKELWKQVQRMVSSAITEPRWGIWLKHKFDESLDEYLVKILGILTTHTQGNIQLFRFSVPLFGRWLRHRDIQIRLIKEARTELLQEYAQDKDQENLLAQRWEQLAESPFAQLLLIVRAESPTPLDDIEAKDAVFNMIHFKFNYGIDEVWLGRQTLLGLETLCAAGILFQNNHGEYNYRLSHFRQWVRAYAAKSNVKRNVCQKVLLGQTRHGQSNAEANLL